MHRNCVWEQKSILYCPFIRTLLASQPGIVVWNYFGTQILGGSRRHTATSSAMLILNQLGYEHYSNCSAHCTRTSTLPLIWIRFADENEHYHRQAIASYHGIDDAHFCWERIWLVWSCSATSVHSVQQASWNDILVTKKLWPISLDWDSRLIDNNLCWRKQLARFETSHDLSNRIPYRCGHHWRR